MTASDEARFIRLGYAIMATSLLSSLSWRSLVCRTLRLPVERLKDLARSTSHWNFYVTCTTRSTCTPELALAPTFSEVCTWYCTWYCITWILSLIVESSEAVPYHTRILTETGTKINFRFRYRRKWTLTRRKSPTDLKPLECRFPDGNEMHSCRLHQSNGNLFEHVKFYILPTFYTLIGWTLIKNALEFQLVEILNFEPVKLVCMYYYYCILCAPHFKRAVPGARYCTIHWTLSLRRCSHEQCWPTAHLLLVMLSIMDTRMGLALSLLLLVIMMTLLSEANRILSLVLQSSTP